MFLERGRPSQGLATSSQVFQACSFQPCWHRQTMNWREAALGPSCHYA
jgi:hypothetical protein